MCESFQPSDIGGQRPKKTAPVRQRRHPVMAWCETDVVDALNAFTERAGLSKSEVARLAVLNLLDDLSAMLDECGPDAAGEHLREACIARRFDGWCPGHYNTNRWRRSGRRDERTTFNKLFAASLSPVRPRRSRRSDIDQDKPTSPA